MALRVIWQYMDRSIYCHMTQSDMKYLLYYTFYLKQCRYLAGPYTKLVTNCANKDK